MAHFFVLLLFPVDASRFKASLLDLLTTNRPLRLTTQYTMSGQRARQLITAAYAQYANDAVSTHHVTSTFEGFDNSFVPSLLK